MQIHFSERSPDDGSLKTSQQSRCLDIEHQEGERAWANYVLGVLTVLREAGGLEAVGDLLFASHESSRADYENSTTELDFIVHHLAEEKSVLGARLTGAGFGGAAMAWMRNTFAQDEARAVERAYAERFGEALEILACQPAPSSFRCRYRP